MPFYMIRRRDSPPCEDEHLMIKFYDLLIVDNVACIHEPHSIRRRRLWATVHLISGRADIGHRVKIDLKLVDGVTRLGEEMTWAKARGWEGLVVKDCEAPYFSVHGDVPQIKLKKDYTPGLGDSADLVVVGGRYDTKEVWAQSEKRIWWTTFYSACLSNKEAVLRSEAKSIFQMVASVTRPCLSMADVRYLNRYGASRQIPFAESISRIQIQIESVSLDRPTELFVEPAVVEVVWAGFDRPANQRFLTLRFPRIVKIHQDRTFKDTPDFTEYQRLAQESMALMAEEDVSSPVQCVESVCLALTPSIDSGTESEDDDENETGKDRNPDEEFLFGI
ncbi:hypothetical protein LTR41_011243 [Exophiala xenobiotica]|nr:hypothetical protein LTR41_011243 [Exophiala xenobiotica]KAK5550928.1 hypothetical protein LTR46_011071 [Exophiala xenobiotica]